MTDHQIYVLVGEAEKYRDRDAFVSDATMSHQMEHLDIPEAAEKAGIIWDAVNLPFSALRSSMNLTQAQMAERLCAPRRTVENWEYRNTCPVYIRLLIARVWLGL